MPSLETVLWKLYVQGDSRISVLESFQRDPYTYVKVAVNADEHDIIVQEIAAYAPSFATHKLDAMKEAMQSALKKAANIITKQALAPIMENLSNDPVY